jgi:hypothetical protein
VGFFYKIFFMQKFDLTVLSSMRTLFEIKPASLWLLWLQMRQKRLPQAQSEKVAPQLP